MDPHYQPVPTPVPISAFSSLTINPTVEAHVEMVGENTPGHGPANGNGNAHGNGRSVISVTESMYARQGLTEALQKIFDEQKVRTIRSVVRDLRDLAKKLSALPRSNDKTKQLIEGALCGQILPLSWSSDVVNCVAELTTSSYMKPPKMEHVRNLFIYLFMEAKPKAVLRKQEIIQCGRELFQKEINESEYAQVVDDICITTEDGGLMLNYGD